VNKVTCSKAELRKAVEDNRTNHREIFEEALAGYRIEQVRALEKHIDALRRGKILRGVYYLPVPEDHTKDYDRVLKMLDMHKPELIEISQEDFAKYVMDDWAWRAQWLGTSANYSNRAKMAFDNEASDD
jgi:hypothetical protein